jgi:hypothetical protein
VLRLVFVSLLLVLAGLVAGVLAVLMRLLVSFAPASGRHLILSQEQRQSAGKGERAQQPDDAAAGVGGRERHDELIETVPVHGHLPRRIAPHAWQLSVQCIANSLKVMNRRASLA